MRGVGRAAGWLAGWLAVLGLLSGCAPLLERTYRSAEPHSSRFWESEAAGTLRAENYQDIVNDLLLLIDQHTETATLRLYDFENDLAVADALEQAATEVQQETPMGAYAVEYITTVSQPQRGYHEAAVRISYRRTAEQLQSVVSATSTEALYSLLEDALKEEKSELAVRIGYWGQDGQSRVEEAVAMLREEWELEEAPDWVVNYYPALETPGLVEFLLDPPPDELGESDESKKPDEPKEPGDDAATAEDGGPAAADDGADGSAEGPGEGADAEGKGASEG